MSLAQFLREIGAPEEIVTLMTGGPSKEQIVSEAFRKMETAIDGHKENGRLNNGRTEDFHFMYSAWVDSLIRTFTDGGVSFKSIASAMAAMEYRIMELEAMLTGYGYELPREPVAPEESDASDNGGKRCAFCGGNH